MRRICTFEFESLWMGSARLGYAVGPAKYVTGALWGDEIETGVGGSAGLEAGRRGVHGSDTGLQSESTGPTVQ
ncbi:hypothetical protein FJT64_008480 [Amphibalanus amphitrite]|uniref:Uncharacterized protein n=1 Tax=Amphibalanus amphitrite TaxID=1232801 RepID=A0A6A4VH77_AMPAM|nr:hypothetical protein FJT64_008480 [Amphibalanus amphitrite]